MVRTVRLLWAAATVVVVAILCGRVCAEDDFFPKHQLSNTRARIAVLGERPWTAATQVLVNGRPAPISSREGSVLSFEMTVTDGTTPVTVTDGSTVIDGEIIGKEPTQEHVRAMLQDVLVFAGQSWGHGLLRTPQWFRIDRTVSDAMWSLDVRRDLERLRREILQLIHWLNSNGALSIPAPIREVLLLALTSILEDIPHPPEPLNGTATAQKWGRAITAEVVDPLTGDVTTVWIQSLKITDVATCWPVTIVTNVQRLEYIDGVLVDISDSDTDVQNDVDAKVADEETGLAWMQLDVALSLDGVAEDTTRVVWIIEITIEDACGEVSKSYVVVTMERL